jgi:hypothetical protein
MRMKVSNSLAVLLQRPIFFADAFDLVVYVSGYATKRRSPEFLTRSQRTFLRLARGALI